MYNFCLSDMDQKPDDVPLISRPSLRLSHLVVIDFEMTGSLLDITEQRTRSVSSGLSKQLGHMPRIRSKQSIHQMGRFAHLSVTLLTQSFSLPLSPVRSDPPKEAVTNDQSRKGNLFDFFACRRS